MKGAWAHLTSWWLYPVIGVIAVLLIVLAVLQIQPEVTLILFRLTVVVSALAYMYDHRWRRPRFARLAATKHEKTKHSGRVHHS